MRGAFESKDTVDKARDVSVGFISLSFRAAFTAWPLSARRRGACWCFRSRVAGGRVSFFSAGGEERLDF